LEEPETFLSIRIIANLTLKGKSFYIAAWGKKQGQPGKGQPGAAVSTQYEDVFWVHKGHLLEIERGIRYYPV